MELKKTNDSFFWFRRSLLQTPLLSYISIQELSHNRNIIDSGMVSKNKKCPHIHQLNIANSQYSFTCILVNI